MLRPLVLHSFANRLLQPQVEVWQGPNLARGSVPTPSSGLAGRQLNPLPGSRVETTAWPETGTMKLWDVCSHVFTETMHQTYVYQAGDVGATSRLRMRPCALGWVTLAQGGHLMYASPAVAALAALSP